MHGINGMKRKEHRNYRDCNDCNKSIHCDRVSWGSPVIRGCPDWQEIELRKEKQDEQRTNDSDNSH